MILVEQEICALLFFFNNGTSLKPLSFFPSKSETRTCAYKFFESLMQLLFLFPETAAMSRVTWSYQVYYNACDSHLDTQLLSHCC